MTITRSEGTPVGSPWVTYGYAGSGYCGITPELDAVVAEAAEALAAAYGMDVEIRFNSDQESGGAWLRTHDHTGIGANAEVGICADIATERKREAWARFAAQDAGMDDGYWQRALDESTRGPDHRVRAHHGASGRGARR